MTDDYTRDLAEQMRRFTGPLEHMRKQLLDPAMQAQMRHAASQAAAMHKQLAAVAGSPGYAVMREQLLDAAYSVSKLREQTGLAALITREQAAQFQKQAAAMRQQIKLMAPAMEAAAGQLRRLTQGIDTNTLHRFTEQMRMMILPPATVLALREQTLLSAESVDRLRKALAGASMIGAVPSTTAFEAFSAQDVVALARDQGNVDTILDLSFAVDAFVATEKLSGSEDAPTAEEIAGIFEAVLAAFKTYLQRAKSAIDLVTLYNTALLLLNVLTVYYAMQSPNAQDFADLGNKFADVTRQEAEASRQHFTEQMGKLTSTIEKLSADKLAAIGGGPIYRADRPVPVKVERKMKSETVGWLQLGQPVFVVSRAKKWIEIEYADLLTGKRERGWVVKKYLTRLN